MRARVKVVEERVLAVYGRFRGVEVLRLLVGQPNATAIGDDLAAVGVDWEHQAVAEAVVKRPVLLRFADQARISNLAALETPVPQVSDQGVAGGGVAETEFGDLRITNPSIPQVSQGFPAAGGAQLLDVKLLREVVDVKQGFPLARRSVRPGTLAASRHLPALLLGQDRQRFEEGQSLYFHQEGEDIPALAAAEALVDLQSAMYGKRRGLLGMERAEADEAVPPLPSEAHILADDGCDIGRCLDFLREVHWTSLAPPDAAIRGLVENLDANVLIQHHAARVVSLQRDRADVKLAQREVLPSTVRQRLETVPVVRLHPVGDQVAINVYLDAVAANDYMLLEPHVVLGRGHQIVQDAIEPARLAGVPSECVVDLDFETLQRPAILLVVGMEVNPAVGVFLREDVDL